MRHAAERERPVAIGTRLGTWSEAIAASRHCDGGGGWRRPAEQLAAAGPRELKASRRVLATLAGRTTCIVSVVGAYLIGLPLNDRDGYGARTHDGRPGEGVCGVTHTPHSTQQPAEGPSQI
eukprot:scaffold39790_cov70-Phaeocystis_antarctica.AAC.1